MGKDIDGGGYFSGDLDLGGCSTEELAKELAGREDLETLVRKDGSTVSAAYTLREKLGAIPCVTSLAIRFKRVHMMRWDAEGGIIRRNNGIGKGKLCFVGGGINRHESIENALRRHWRIDLGVSIELPLGWRYPVSVGQYAPYKECLFPDFFDDDPHKHGVASLHLVSIPENEKIVFGEKFGQQEAMGFEWYTRETCPSASEWGFGECGVFLQALDYAEKHRPQIQKFLNESPF